VSEMDTFRELLQRNLSRGTHYKPDVVDGSGIAEKVRAIAFYLPQFHQIPENDEWWGRGFTEWTNVTKALPQFEGHYQPRLPDGLGFYDLKNPGILEQQARLAKRYGIHGFCFHHYWFSGRTLLDHPINSLLANKSLDLRFCINWANENWSRVWDGRDRDILIKQEYRPDDDEKFATNLLKYVEDTRYITVGKRPFVMIYRPKILPNPRKTVEILRETFIRAGIENPYVAMAQAFNDTDPLQYGMDGAVEFPPHKVGMTIRDVNSELEAFDSKYKGTVFRYEDIVAASTMFEDVPFTVFKGVCPGWDNTARKPNNGLTYHQATPEKYADWLERACRQTIQKNQETERLVFINAWNEWAEGAHLEPDRHFGYAYLAATREVLQRLSAPRSGDLYAPKVDVTPARKLAFKISRIKRRVFGS
jgi:lipopolysaccharide biosynthesis protein